MLGAIQGKLARLTERIASSIDKPSIRESA